ncbi:MAG: hypothetical protein ACSHW0_03365 [Thalassotalea sp.]
MKKLASVLTLATIILSSFAVQAKGKATVDIWDTNDDKKVSFDEYSVGVKKKGKLKKRFEGYDKNSDGFLTPDEMNGVPKPRNKKQK